MKWREGKRQGGWKLKAKSATATAGAATATNLSHGGEEGNNDQGESSIDRTLDWTCCGRVLPAKQTRCGKCHGWRGGKRVFKGMNTRNDEQVVVDGSSGEQKKATAAAQPLPLMRSVVDGARSLTNLGHYQGGGGGSMFDYYPMSYSMIVPEQQQQQQQTLHHPPLLLPSGYHQLPSPIVGRNDEVAQSTEV